MKKLKFIALISFLVALLDHLTKWIIVTTLTLHEVIDILPFLRIVHVKNPGAAFGLFSNIGNNIFIFISLAAMIFIIVYSFKIPKGLELFSLSLILGGAVGNLIDRVMIGKVVDFIDFFVGKWHWPAFNVADSALSIGIVLFLWANLKHGKDPKEK